MSQNDYSAINCLNRRSRFCHPFHYLGIVLLRENDTTTIQLFLIAFLSGLINASS
jgi:hypothetical protein